ncbi:MAG TPA: TonB family protein [Acidobacteriaceae bacterium]|nr:TonB family protein [Acidobacteriaceae bacterium]
MPKPLRSDDPNPQPVQFAHFGVLNDGTRSKGATVTAIIVNCTIAALVVILGMVIKTNPIVAKRVTELMLPPQPKVEPAPKPPPPPPPPKIKMPPPPKIETPKIKMPEPVKLPEIKPVAVESPKPVIMPPAPKKVTPPPAPVKVNLGVAMAASVPNHDANPTAVRLGSSTNPLKPLTGPAVSPVNMGAAGMPGMNKGNTGNGPHAVSVSMGSGSPDGRMGGHDNAVRAVSGSAFGVPGGTGHARPAGPVQVAIQTQMQPAQVARPQVQQSSLASAPKVTYKPTPVYTEEAKAMHLEGNVSLRIRVTASGAVQVLGVVHGLGHGLDQSAIQATEATRFKPALDTSGRAIDWEGVVLVNFQMS